MQKMHGAFLMQRNGDDIGMFFIDNDKTIHLTRGDVASIVASAKMQNGDVYTFEEGDVVRFTVFEKKNPSAVLISKDVAATPGGQDVTISLQQEETKIGELISKPTDYWYEVVLNPDTRPQTIIGYDDNGAKIFKLYPEGGVYNAG